MTVKKREIAPADQAVIGTIQLFGCGELSRYPGGKIGLAPSPGQQTLPLRCGIGPDRDDARRGQGFHTRLEKKGRIQKNAGHIVSGGGGDAVETRLHFPENKGMDQLIQFTEPLRRSEYTRAQSLAVHRTSGRHDGVSEIFAEFPGQIGGDIYV